LSFFKSLQVLDHLFKLLPFSVPAWRGLSFRLACWVCCWFPWSNNRCHCCISSWQDGMYCFPAAHCHLPEGYKMLKQFIASVWSSSYCFHSCYKVCMWCAYIFFVLSLNCSDIKNNLVQLCTLFLWIINVCWVDFRSLLSSIICLF
jgi:hypothetical protein